MSYHVPISSLPLVQDPPFVLTLTLLGTALGYRLLRWLRAPLGEVSALERGAISAALGLGLLQYLPFGLGGGGLLKPGTLRLGLGLLALLLAPDMIRVVRGIGRAVQRRRRALPEAWMLAGAVPILVVLGVALLYALCPPTDPDGIGYHLVAPKRFLQSGHLQYLPTLIHTQAPMGVEMLFTLALALWSETAAKLIHYAFGVLTLLALLALGRRLRGEAVGFALAALWLLLAPRVSALGLFSWAYVDLGITLEIVCAVLSWLLWSRTGARGWLWGAALCAGFAASFKLTGSFVGLGLGLLTLWELRRQGRPIGEAGKLAALFVGLALLPVLPWLGRTWLLTGNPVYPVFSNLFPTRDWSPQAARAFDEYMKYYNWGTGIGGGWNLGQRKLARLAAMLLTVGIGAALIWRWKDWEARALAALTTLLLLIALGVTGLYLRLLMPLLPLVYVVLCLALAKPLTRSRALQWALVGALVLQGMGYVRGQGAELGLAAETAAGRVSRDAYLAQKLPLTRLWDRANSELPENARVAVILSGAPYYSDQECFMIDPTLQWRIRLDTWEHFLSDLRRDNIGYAVMLDAPEEGERVRPENPVSINLQPFGLRLVRTYGQELCAVGHDKLYRLEGLTNAAPLPTATTQELGRAASK